MKKIRVKGKPVRKLFWKCPQVPRLLLQVGIALRVVTFWFLAPANNDNHSGVIKFIVDTGRLPPALTPNLAQAQHPPLYYVLAAPLLQLSGSFKVVQAFSLACSIVTLLVLYRLIYHERLIENAQARLYSFLVVCFLPQFVMFSLYISNDTLVFLLGAVAIWQAYRFVTCPSWKQLILLSSVTSLGLLTKATFLAFVPPLFVLVLSSRWRGSGWNAVSWGAVFLAIALGVGSFKAVDNFRHYGKPFINAMDYQVARVNTQFDRGFRSYIDLNVGRLLISPTESPVTKGSYPVLLYGTFWYQHILHESNFRGSTHRVLRFLGVAIYIVAMVPSAVFFLGLFALGKSLPRFARSSNWKDIAVARSATTYIAVAILLTLAVGLFATMAKYHWWQIMQGRYLFTGLIGGCGAFAAGVEVVSRYRLATVVLRLAMIALVGLFGLYFLSEIALLLIRRA